MSLLPHVENAIKKTIQRITENNNIDNNEPDNSIKIFAALKLGFNFVTEGWIGDDRRAEDIIDTLIALLSDSDRRVMVLVIILLGLIQEIFGTAGLYLGGLARAIPIIDDIAKRNTDINIGTACGLTNAILGFKPAKYWMSQQMEKFPNLTEMELRKSMRLMILNHIAKGWI